jgi:hypothetical protein
MFANVQQSNILPMQVFSQNDGTGKGRIFKGNGALRLIDHEDLTGFYDHT